MNMKFGIQGWHIVAFLAIGAALYHNKLIEAFHIVQISILLEIKDRLPEPPK